MQTHAAAFARRLHDRGHQVAIAAYAQSDNPAAAASYDAAQPFPTLRCLSRLSYWGNVRTILGLAGRFHPDLIYSSTPFFGLLNTMSGLPVVCRSVGNDIMRCWIPYPFHFGSGLMANQAVESRLYALYRRLRAPAWLEGAFSRARRDLVQRAARAASAIIANSQFTRERLLELGVSPDAVTIIPGGVDAIRFATGADGTLSGRLNIVGASPILLTVCRLVAKKGLGVLLKAMAKARRELPGLTLVVVGDGPERARCEQLAMELGLTRAVRFVGRVPHEEVAGYYHAADCFVLASRVHKRRNGWADVETMGRVICEANAAGLPAIVTETGGTSSVVVHWQNGLLVPPDDPSALAAAIVALWRNAPLRARLRAGGLRRAREEFDWEVVTTAYERVFELALKQASHVEGARGWLPPISPAELVRLKRTGFDIR